MSEGRGVVAESDGRVLGTATMGANRPGRGAHIATGSFRVAPEAQGRRAGRALGERVVDWARRAGG
jgi:GNAT superfamily N-acetyltransferase